MSEQKKESESSIYNNPFLRPDAPPVIEDPYSVPIEENQSYRRATVPDGYP
ncbi:MAG: hypothetical protein ACNYPE_02695 [Candidatus Azotimanducaceae bacterium WSBS_2022_MAG_OTU7]